jgi:hypothetical protein
MFDIKEYILLMNLKRRNQELQERRGMELFRLRCEVNSPKRPGRNSGERRRLHRRNVNDFDTLVKHSDVYHRLDNPEEKALQEKIIASLREYTRPHMCVYEDAEYVYTILLSAFPAEEGSTKWIQYIRERMFRSWNLEDDNYIVCRKAPKRSKGMESWCIQPGIFPLGDAFGEAQLYFQPRYDGLGCSDCCRVVVKMSTIARLDVDVNPYSGFYKVSPEDAGSLFTEIEYDDAMFDGLRIVRRVDAIKEELLRVVYSPDNLWYTCGLFGQ